MSKYINKYTFFNAPFIQNPIKICADTEEEAKEILHKNVNCYGKDLAGKKVNRCYLNKVEITLRKDCKKGLCKEHPRGIPKRKTLAGIPI